MRNAPPDKAHDNNSQKFMQLYHRSAYPKFTLLLTLKPNWATWGNAALTATFWKSIQSKCTWIKTKRKFSANNSCQELLLREEGTEHMQVYVNSKKRLRRCADIFGSDPFSSFAEMLTNRGKKIYAFDSNFPGLCKYSAEHWLSIKQCFSVAVLDDVEVLYTFLSNLCENFLVPLGRLTMLSTSLLDLLTPKIWLLILPSSCYTFPF